MSALIPISVPGTDSAIQAASIDGKPFVALKPMCESIGIDYKNQHEKLGRKSWAVMVLSTTTGADGKSYQMSMIDRRTMTMWLATIDEGRVAEAARPTIRAYQSAAADALDAYFHEGGAINPAATVDQLDALAVRARTHMEIIRLAEGIIDARHLESKARIVLARALGETPELDPAGTPLYAQDYLKSKGWTKAEMHRHSGTFGKRLKGMFIAEHGHEPSKTHQELPNGTVRQVNAYTEADRPLFDEVWNRYYAAEVA